MTSDLLDLLTRLVAIDSVNPFLVPGGSGEARAAEAVREWAQAAGLETEWLEATPGRPSVVIRARGTGGGKTLLLCGHLDTVGVAGMTDPHLPRLDGDRLYGRGAYDMKAGLAAALIACREAASLNLRGDVIVAAVADEEHASLGIQEVLRLVKADAAIVTEPTELELVIAHKGFVWLEVAVTGKAAHGSRPHLGVDAIVKTGAILTAIGRLDESFERNQHPLLGRPSVHASLVSGGAELSSYPAECVVSLERRTLPGETVAEIEGELSRLLDACRVADPLLDAAQRTLLSREPFELGSDTELVRLARGAYSAMVGREPTVAGASYWADSGFIAEAGIPTVLFGPGGAGAHEHEEWVSITDSETVAGVLVAVATELCE